MTITWGDITFDGPYPTTRWEPPYRAAIYAIMVKTDDRYRIIYFGESGNLSDRGFWRSHHRYQCFIDNAGSESNIYIGIYRMPNSTKEERKAVEQRLVDRYDPVCNR